MDYDLVVVGAGSGGVRAARMAAQAGKRVAVVEYQALGGTCVNLGCVPKKLFVYASQVSDSIRDASGFGWTIPTADFNWQQLVQNKNREIAGLNTIYRDLLQKAGVEIVEGLARFVSSKTIDVFGKKISAQHFLIATGARPHVPDFPGKELVSTSNDMFFLKHLPKNILIVGGGYIALEFAGIFNALGVQTLVSYRGENILRGFDNAVREVLAREIQKKGVVLRCNSHVKSIRKALVNGLEMREVHFENGEVEHFESVLYATGRRPNVEHLALDTLGIELSKDGGIAIDAHFKTSVEGIYALGDVTHKLQLTPVATAEAMTFVNQLYGDNTKRMNYENVPSAVFSQPSVACVGLTEEAAREKGFAVDVFISEFEPMKFALSDNTERTFMKLIVDSQTDKVLGAHMIGADAAEIIQGLAIAIKSGARKQDFDATIGIHPSSAEEFVTMRTPGNG